MTRSRGPRYWGSLLSDRLSHLCYPAPTRIVAALMAAVVASAALASATPVSASTVAQLLPGTGMVEGVACATTSTCVAVDTSGFVEAFTFTGSGAITAAPAQRVDAGLNAVSCPSTRLCVAVGEGNNVGVVLPLIISSSGDVTIGTPQNVPGTNKFNAVACPSSATCLAVGSFIQVPQAVPLELGFGGAIVPIGISGPGAVTEGTVSSLPDFNNLFGVACPTVTTCIGVGSGRLQLPGPNVVMITLNSSGPASVGQEWPLGTGNGLLGIACPAPTECVAVTADAIVPITGAGSASTLTVGNLQRVSGVGQSRPLLVRAPRNA